MTAILTLLIIPNNVKALTIPHGHGGNYFVIKYNNPKNTSGDVSHPYYIYFTNSNYQYINGYVQEIGAAADPLCVSENTWCLKTLRSYPRGGNSNARYSYVMYSDDGDNWTYIGGNRSFTGNLFDAQGYILQTSVDILSLDQQLVYYEAGYQYRDLPNYLDGYVKRTLAGISYNEDHYFVISGISSGSFYVPYEHVRKYGGGFYYMNSNWESVPYAASVNDYYIMEDKLFVRYDFNIENFPDAEFIVYAKYWDMEGTDYPEVDIYIPPTSYGSYMQVTIQDDGGIDFTYEWKDSQGTVSTTTNETQPQNNNPLLPDFLQDFSTNTFGLTSVITAPLNIISNITNPVCTEITIPLPYVDKNITLPCMSTIYSTTFGEAFTLYQTLSFGFVSYWVIVRILNLVKDFKNPDHDEIEVVDL